MVAREVHEKQSNQIKTYTLVICIAPATQTSSVNESINFTKTWSSQVKSMVLSGSEADLSYGWWSSCTMDGVFTDCYGWCHPRRIIIMSGSGPPRRT